MAEFKGEEHLTLQVSVALYGDRVLATDVQNILGRLGKRLSQEALHQVEDALAVELSGEPGQDWQVRLYVGADEHFNRVLLSLINTGRCDGLTWALRFLEHYHAAVKTRPDLEYLITRLKEELEKEEAR